MTETNNNNFSESETNWFSGGLQIVETTHLVSESLIVSEKVATLDIYLTPVSYLSALSTIGSDVWDMLRVGGTHKNPTILSGHIYSCPICQEVDDNVGECEECFHFGESNDEYCF